MTKIFLSLFIIICNNVFSTKDANQNLLKACIHEDLEQVKQSLADGADANTKDMHGNSVLILACITKNTLNSRTIKKLLIEAGADVNAKDQIYGMPVLTWVFVSRDYENINLLLQYNVDINGTNKDGSNLLALAMVFTSEEFKESSEILELLVTKGLDLNPISTSGETILTHAAKEDKIDLVAFLLTHHVSVNLKDKEGQTALMYACDNDNISMVKLLLENNADVNLKDKNGWVPGSTALMRAVDKDNVDIVKLLINKGSDINAKNKGGSTALHNAASNGHIDMIKLLLANGANPKMKNKDLKTPLDLAKTTGKSQAVELLSKY